MVHHWTSLLVIPGAIKYKIKKSTTMNKIFLFIILIFVCNNIICGQTLSSNVDVIKLNAKANVLAKKFGDCIVIVGTSGHLNGISYSTKKKVISEIGKNFYNYYEDPRRMTTTRSNGEKSKKPIHTYLNNLLAQSNSANSMQMRKYEIRWDFYCLNNGDIREWKFLRRLSDGCNLYYRDITFSQIYRFYRVIDVCNKNPEHRNVEHTEIDKKTIRIYAIQKPNTDRVVVLLGDIIRSECKDSRK